MLLNGCWEKKSPNRNICRWFIVWEIPEPGCFVGAIAGYSGHAAFQVERFMAVGGAEGLTHFYCDYRDLVTGEEIDFEARASSYLGICEKALDSIWEWNDQDEWNDSDDVVLRQEKKKHLRQDSDLLFLSTSDAPFLRQCCELVGLTAGPCSTKP